jgi:hypothetical protein
MDGEDWLCDHEARCHAAADRGSRGAPGPAWPAMTRAAQPASSTSIRSPAERWLVAEDGSGMEAMPVDRTLKGCDCSIDSTPAPPQWRFRFGRGGHPPVG